MDSWDKIQIMCQSHGNKKDCQGCGFNTINTGFKWQLDARIPCTNAVNNHAILIEVK